MADLLEMEADLLHSEVWKARSRRHRRIFALKKILMHNEKEGVRTGHYDHRVRGD